MAYIFYSLLTVAIYVYLGLGLSILFCPRSLNKYVLFLSPIVGYSYLTLMGWYCYSFDIGGTNVYAKYILIPPAIFIFFALLKNPINTIKKTLFNKSDVAVFVIAYLCFIVISLPVITDPISLNSISIGNNDPTNYAFVSRALKEFSRSNYIGYFKQSLMPGGFRLDLQIESTVFGAFICTSFLASLLSLEVYQVQNLTIHVFLMFSIAIVYVIAKQIFKYRTWTACVAAFFYGVNPIIYYAVYQGFQSQIIATSLSLCIFLINVQAITSCRTLSSWSTYIFLSVLFDWGLALTYPHMLPIIYIPLIIYSIFYGFHTKSRGSIVQFFSFVAATVLLVSALSIPRLKALLSYVLLMGSVEAGWYTPFVWPNRIFTAIHDDNHNSILQFSSEVVLSIILVVCVGIGLAKTRRKDYNSFLLAAIYAIIIYSGCIILSILDLGKPQVSGYKSYKLLSFFLPQILAGCLMPFIIGCSELLGRVKLTKAKKTQIALFSLLILLQTYNTLNFTSFVAKDHISITQELIDLKRVENASSIHSINMLGVEQNWWQIRWQAYFLARKKLYLQTDLFSPTTIFDGEYDLLDAKEGEDSCKEVKNYPNSTVINSRYRIQRASDLKSISEGKKFAQEVRLLEPLRSSRASEIIKIPVSIKNTSNFFWNSKCANPVDFSYNWFDAKGNRIVWDGERTALPSSLAPQSSIKMNPVVKLPNQPGRYILALTMVQEGVAWFSDAGAASPRIPVTVTSQ